MPYCLGLTHLPHTQKDRLCIFSFEVCEHLTLCSYSSLKGNPLRRFPRTRSLWPVASLTATHRMSA